MVNKLSLVRNSDDQQSDVVRDAAVAIGRESITDSKALLHAVAKDLADPVRPTAPAWRHRWVDAVRRDRLFGLDLVHARIAEAARELVTAAALGAPVTLQFINAHCINSLRGNAQYRAALDAADLLFPDGSGMRLAGKLSGVALGDNLNGTDLFPELCARAATLGQSIYLLGGRPGIAAAAAAAMADRYPGLMIAGTRDGYWSADGEDAVIDAINASGARIVLVGMGVPLQETWIAKVRDRLHAPLVAGVGGLFDYYSGAVARAPLAFRKTGCEWVWRLMQEPRRLFARYVLGNPLFILAALLHGWRHHPLGRARSATAKRAMDLAFAGAALLFAAPLFALIALAIKLEDGGPVFFAQNRIGKHGKPFRMWKFRSMVVNAAQLQAALLAQSDRDATCFKMKHDPRVTRVGRLLRRLSLDELPQFFNIFAGDMALVGPRPALPREVLLYNKGALRRLGGKPGLTGRWQVAGRARIPFETMVEMDVAYLEERSLARDIALVARTVPAVLTARGAY